MMKYCAFLVFTLCLQCASSLNLRAVPNLGAVTSESAETPKQETLSSKSSPTPVVQDDRKLKRRVPSSVSLNTPPLKTVKSRTPQSVPAKLSNDWILELPGDGGKEFLPAILRKVKHGTWGRSSADEALSYSQRIAKYVSFIMTGSLKDSRSSDVNRLRIAMQLINRLLSSSTQFILCPRLEDLECLEKTPVIIPTNKARVESWESKLGERLAINQNIEDQMEWFFSKQIFVPDENLNWSDMAAQHLVEKIKNDGQDEIFAALYGMDDIFVDRNSSGSLAGVYEALIDKIASQKTDVKAVLDVRGIAPSAKPPLIFSYVKPEKLESWILSPAPHLRKGNETNLDFQYNGGTQELLFALNKGIQRDEDAKGRLEFSNDGIMHNKFFIFKNGKQSSVWTGTANISRTCLGAERNSNMSLYIKNNQIAQAFRDEFQEMFEFQNPTPNDSSLWFRGIDGGDFPVGRFHGKKKPNTHRLFGFKDKDVRVYFAPTDDAEHRAILPMIHSARNGDSLYISMFGAGGIEHMRALQLAASRGVDVKIIVDVPTACGSGSWAGRGGDASLIELNPFSPETRIELRANTKGSGEVWKQNHQKIGALVRDGKVNQLIIGSQNWSDAGNDKNDENVLAFTRKKGSFKMAEDFVDHFLNFLWPNARDISNGCSKDANPAPSEDGAEESSSLKEKQNLTD